ncbi:universal stress protein [Pseudanabaena sp. FACHB-1277]|jgi:nucleotide-binding universal stress UspA family protein|uniref:Universal stress protein n=1 Tax=Pseudanabaena cinerea FACHB-1277 TaxID=2949581 RepID=A0A926Z5X5_9CYAN|nr:universal stress protein [Pseudanabaena cinerea]MBD2150726.1 universal stress protein [Pseudanabaena cinerea FACHB-1277]
MLHQILLAVDGSGRSREMLNMLLAFPSIQNSQINVLHVIPNSINSESVAEYRLAGEKIIEREINNLRLTSGNTTVPLLKEGEPKDVVCKVAEELKADLLIIGSRGMGRLQAILANSVSQYVFQLSDVPMLLIKDDVYVKTIRSVMVSVDGSAAANHSLDLAIKLASGAKDVEIFLARIVKKNDDTTASNDPVLAEAAAKLKRLNIPARSFVGSGDVGRELCRLADESNASLLMLGSPDRRPSIARSLPDLDRLLGTSVSDYVRVNATVPVLLTRTIE